jgi:hypothetical protein
MHIELQPLPTTFRARFISIDRSVLLYSPDGSSLRPFVNIFDKNFNWGYNGHETNNLLFSLYMGLIAPYKGATASGVIQMPSALKRTPKIDKKALNRKIAAARQSAEMYQAHQEAVKNIILTELSDATTKTAEQHSNYLNALSNMLLNIPEMGVFDIECKTLLCAPWINWKTIPL